MNERRPNGTGAVQLGGEQPVPIVIRPPAQFALILDAEELRVRRAIQRRRARLAADWWQSLDLPRRAV